ncbi:putative O-methyltransferase [Sclerotinia borealis F-4128]|uniref:Putative O-methyltransferase n=1 Tax=Sclerotinia borealis (strain F-4128) TaxID=1432307 RepID=W9CKM0_SCLBF|nr:putative O-methyltransferase [Sclerotinia borealis F-4128]
MATKELGDLVKGAKEGLRWLAWDFYDVLSLGAIYHYGIGTSISLVSLWSNKRNFWIAKAFPLQRTVTFEENAQKVGLDVNEVEPEVVAHTVASKMLAEDQSMMDWVGVCVEEVWPGAERTIEALTQYPSASELTQTGFCLANGTTNSGKGYEVSHLIDNYDWASFNSHSGTIVDLGGSHGFVCIELARRFSNLKLIVQDLSITIATAPALDASLSTRIMNKCAANMPCQHKPASKKGARVLIDDYCLPEAGKYYTAVEVKAMRTMDLNMLSTLNAQERGESDWDELFGGVKGFRFLGVKRPVGCRMSLIEAVWEGEESDE